MAYDRGHVYVTWGGGLGVGNQEIWQTGVRLAPSVAGDTPAFPTLAQGQALMNAMQTKWIQGANQTINWCTLKWVKFSEIGTSGALLGQPLVIPSTPSAGIAGPQSTVSHPFQISYVMTLWSGQTYGKGNYGRCYLPGPAFASNNDGAISGSQASYVDWFGSWLKGIEASAATWPNGTAPLFVHIMHQGNSAGGERSSRVAKVRGGSIMDTQRRRRNKLREGYVDATTYP
jgi:hypothetical protein